MDISLVLLTLVVVMLTVEHKKCQKSFFGLVCDESDGRFQEADVCLSVLGKSKRPTPYLEGEEKGNRMVPPLVERKR